MFSFALPLLLFASAPDGYQMLKCEDYDWLTSTLDSSTAMDTKDRVEIMFVLMEQTDPACFELEAEDAKAD